MCKELFLNNSHIFYAFYFVVYQDMQFSTRFSNSTPFYIGMHYLH